MLRRSLAFVALCILPAFALAQLPPDKALATMQVADGLQVELFAAEPMLINPTSIDVDHLGRVWVCEAVNYRCFLRNRPLYRDAGDRIVILTDKDGDGKADASTVFYQGKDLIAPIGIAIAPIAPTVANASGSACRVFVCQSPDILLFEDLDGDGKADGPPKKFLSGFKGFDHDHGVHGINIGPDGKLYFTVGDAGVDGLKSSDGKGRVWKSNSTDCRAGTVWRCDMDGKNLELIAHNFRNNYECCVNSFGEIWLSDNDDDGNQQTRICYVMPGGNYGYHPRGPGQSHWHEEQPGIVPKVLRTGFGSPTGICFYEGTLLPKKYHGQLLHTDAGPRELRVFHLKPKGAGYEAEKEVLLTSTDHWFRPSDVCVAPDGSLIVADWYDPGVGGHGMGDTTRGRIYRITPKGQTGYKIATTDLQTKEGWQTALRSPNLAARYTAMSQIDALDRAKVDEIIGRTSVDKIVAVDQRARQYWQAGRLKVTGSSYWLDMYRGLDNKREIDPRLRELAIRIQKDCFGVTPDEFVSHANDHWREEVTADPAASVRREALFALRDVAVLSAAPMFFNLAKKYDGQDRFYLAALNIACGTDPERRAKILADFDKHFPELNDKTLDLIWELRPPSAIARLEKQLGDTKLTAAQRGRIVDILAFSDEPAAGKTMLKLLTGDAPAEVKTRALENLKLFLPTKWSAVVKSDEFKSVIEQVSATPQAANTGLQLIAAAKYTAAIPQVAKLAAAHNTEAIRTLGHLPDIQAVAELGKLLRPDSMTPINVAKEVVGALGQLAAGKPDSQAAVAAGYFLQMLVTAGGRPLEIQLAAVGALAGSRPGTDWLLKLNEDGKMPEAIVADTGRLLRNSPFQGQRNKALLLFPPPGKLDPKKLPSIATLARRSGNAENGRKLLAASAKNEAQCLKCHTIRGVGGAVGPDLSMIGKKASRENLIESILNPSKAIADQYIQWRIETKNGQDITGLLIEETKEHVLLRDANAKDHRIAVDNIETRTKSAVSIMPENLVSALTEDELIDVVEYMFSLKTPSLTPDFWHIAGPFPNDTNDTGLDAVYEPEKKVDLRATYQSPKRERGERGPLAWTHVKRNGDGYVDLQAHYAPNSANITSYLYREIESAVDQDATLLLGTDDGAKVWLNGKEVFSTRAHRAAAPEQDRVKVQLKKGTNRVLIKIVNGDGPHGLYFSVLAAEELKAGK